MKKAIKTALIVILAVIIFYVFTCFTLAIRIEKEVEKIAIQTERGIL